MSVYIAFNDIECARYQHIIVPCRKGKCILDEDIIPIWLTSFSELEEFGDYVYPCVIDIEAILIEIILEVGETTAKVKN
jgi:hypothetical protein